MAVAACTVAFIIAARKSLCVFLNILEAKYTIFFLALDVVATASYTYVMSILALRSRSVMAYRRYKVRVLPERQPAAHPTPER